MGSNMNKSLDVKIARILADPSVGDFILADAKDADMAAGMAAPGKSPEHHAQEGKFRSLAEYRELIRQNIIDQMRIARCLHVRLSGLDRGKEAQKRPDIVAFRKSLPLHQIVAAQNIVRIKKAVRSDEIDLWAGGPAG